MTPSKKLLKRKAMIHSEEFNKVVDTRFWQLAVKLQPNEVADRVATLNSLCKEINNGTYSPGSPAIIMEQDKGFGIVRHIPVFSVIDYAVYYYCVKKLDPVLAKKRIPNTYGGWSLGGRIRDLEESEDEYSLDYELSFSYNPRAWAKHYGEFNSKLYKQLLKYKKLKGYRAVEFDLANYYDSVRLDIRERKIRADSDFQETEVLNLLFYFLNYRDRRLSNYSPQHVGLPQDAIGDCSRLLANYYIQDYDQFMFDLLKENNGNYFRFADDQYIFCKEQDINKVLQTASRKLFEIGLNINQLKVKSWNLDDLIVYRSFDIFDILSNPEEGDLKEKINEFAEKTFAISKPQELKQRGYPLLKRLLTFDFNLLKPDLRAQLVGKVINKEFTHTSRGYTMTNIYKRLKKDERKDYLDFLKDCSEAYLHNAFHYELVAFAQRANLSAVKKMAILRILQLNKERGEVSVPGK